MLDGLLKIRKPGIGLMKMLKLEEQAYAEKKKADAELIEKIRKEVTK